MNTKRKTREPFFVIRVMNAVLGLVILGMLFVVLFREEKSWLLESTIFAMAAIQNFIAATISIAEQKKIRGNVYAALCAIFFVAILLKAGYQWIFV